MEMGFRAVKALGRPFKRWTCQGNLLCELTFNNPTFAVSADRTKLSDRVNRSAKLAQYARPLHCAFPVHRMS